MNIAHLGAISTSVVIAIGLAMIIPAFTQHYSNGYTTKEEQTPVILSFNVLESKDSSFNVSDWCRDLALVLEKHKVPAVVFLSGKIAQTHPQCVSSFPADVDIGSQTYSYFNLAAADYDEALEEVKKGKLAVDEAGNLDSKLFRAPYGSTDENIYSLLTRSNITSDFSYKEQYNNYENGLFIRYDLVTLDASSYSSILENRLELSNTPIDIIFDNSIQPDDIGTVIVELKSDYGSSFRFTSPSGLTGIELTIREGEVLT